MRTQVKKSVFGRRSLLAMGVAAALSAAPVSATLVDTALSFTPATVAGVPAVPVANLLAAFQQAGDLTGLSVATDGNTLVIGAPQMAGQFGASFGVNIDTPLAAGIVAPGKVYVYERNPNPTQNANGQIDYWVQVATLMASNGATRDGFGSSVAVDGNTIVVGADGALSGQGRVYVFEKPTVGSWLSTTITTETSELLPLIPGVAAPAPLSANSAYFGHAVDIKGNTVVVGQWDQGAAAYIFEKPVGGWASAPVHNQTATLQPLLGGIPPVAGLPPTQFGMSVAIDADLAAGTETVVVGGDLVFFQTNGGPGAGAVYLFEKPTTLGGWGDLLPNAIPTATLTLSPVIDAMDNGQKGSRLFGFDVDIKGNTVVAGAPRFDLSVLGVNSVDAGAVFVFEKPANTLWSNMTETAMLNAPTPKGYQSFGRSVSVTKERILAGSFTNPAGRPDPVVGYDLVGGALAAPQGSAYIFDKPSAGWVSGLVPAEWQAPLDVNGNSTGSIDDMFGYSVAAAGTTYVAGGFALDKDLPATSTLNNPVIDNNVGSAAVKEATVKLVITNTLPSGTDPANLSLGNHTYTITVTNNDSVDTATGVVVTDTLPVGLTLTGITNPLSPTTGTCTNLNPAIDPAQISCDLGALTPNSSATITLIAAVDPTLATGHTAFVSSNESVDTVASQIQSAVNSAPIASATIRLNGASVTSIDEGATATLDGTASSDTAPGTIQSYAWVQTSGDSVTLTGANTATATFTAPTLTASSTLPLSFKLTVTDDGKATASTVASISVNDVTPPQITAPLAISFEATAVQTPLTETDFGTATATDASAVTVSRDVQTTFPVGDTTVTWTATANNLSSTATQVITVVDTTAPTITASDDVTVEAVGVNTAVTLIKPVTNDLFPVTLSTPPATFPIGKTVVTWTATDANNQSSTATQTVTVSDTTAPIITTPVAVSVEATGVNTNVVVGAPSTSDLFAVTISSDAPATFPVGDTVVTWTATDANKQISTASQTITVKDTLAPTLTLTGGDTLIQVGDTFNAPSATATDLVSGTVAVTDDRATALNTAVAGSYDITFSALDGAGNTATQVHTVVVNGLPVINGVPTSSVVAGQSYSYSLNATDTNGDALSYALLNAPAWLTLDSNGVLSGSPAVADVGLHENITITVSDGNGGSTSVGPFNVEVTAVPAATTGGGGGGSLPLSLLAVLMGLGLRRRVIK